MEKQITMTRHNANNERIKRKYFAFLKEAKRQSEQTVDATAKALDRFEVHTDQHPQFQAFLSILAILDRYGS